MRANDELPGDPDLHRDLSDLGFRLIQEGRGGVLQFSRRRSPHLEFWVHYDPNAATILFTWEHAIAEYLATRGMQVGSNETLNQFLFPTHDARGPAEIGFVVNEMDRTEAMLAGLDFVDGA